MQLTVLTLLLFATVFVAFFALAAATMAPTSTIGFRLRSLVGTPDAKPKMGLEERFQQKVLDPLSTMALPRSPDEVGRVRAMLMMAGYREPRHFNLYYGIRVFLALVLAGLVTVTGIAFQKPVIVIAAAALGFLLPRFMLKRMIKARQRRIRLGLADALDLAVICVEAGLGLDQALQRVGQDLRYAHPDISDEFNLVNLEMRAGKPRAEALRNLGSRTAVDDMKALVAVLIQTDRFGTSIAQALRVHSDSLRTERRQRAEEQAAKTTIKMVPVLVFFIFPSMFIVSLGPAFIQLVRHLLPAIQK